MKITVYLADKSVDLVVNYETATVGEIKHRALQEFIKTTNISQHLTNTAMFSRLRKVNDAPITLCLNDKKLIDEMLLSESGFNEGGDLKLWKDHQIAVVLPSKQTHYVTVNNFATIEELPKIFCKIFQLPQEPIFSFDIMHWADDSNKGFIIYVNNQTISRNSMLGEVYNEDYLRPFVIEDTRSAMTVIASNLTSVGRWFTSSFWNNSSASQTAQQIQYAAQSSSSQTNPSTLEMNNIPAENKQAPAVESNKPR